MGAMCEICENRKDLELYIHIPFCIKKCNYCDFLSFPSSAETGKSMFDVGKRDRADRYSFK